MSRTVKVPERFELAPGLDTSRLITGLWQIADLERKGGVIDPEHGARWLEEYVAAGFDSFDMADHYGSAEIIAGRLLKNLRKKHPQGSARVFTKWCPEPGPMTSESVRRGVGERLQRLATDRIDLLQLHWWSFEHPAYLDATRELCRLQEEGVIGHLGVTNFNTDHLRVLAGQGFRIATNQVCCSLLDRRATGDMQSFCHANNIRLLAYGALAGGFLSEKWLGRPEPDTIGDWSGMKYRRFIEAAGGWSAFQALLRTISEIAEKHRVSISNVAVRWVLDQPAVAAVIVGARLGERQHRDDNLQVFSFALDREDLDRLNDSSVRLNAIPGDCGDEYRHPPFLTASGDLSHHITTFPKLGTVSGIPGRPGVTRLDTGSIWEPLAGYSRAIRHGNRIAVSGTTATHGSGEVVCKGDPAGQAIYILDKISASLTALGGSLDDIVRTRIYLKDVNHWEPVSRVHGRYLGHIRPANTLVGADLVGDYLVEIEADAELSTP